jgi:hypothetical protein
LETAFIQGTPLGISLAIIAYLVVAGYKGGRGRALTDQGDPAGIWYYST